MGRVISDHPSPPPPLYSSITSHWCIRPVSEMSQMVTSPNILGFVLVSPYLAKTLRTQPPLLIAYPHPFDPTAQHTKRNLKLGKLSDLREPAFDSTAQHIDDGCSPILK
jgi:hypothetical protein